VELFGDGPVRWRNGEEADDGRLQMAKRHWATASPELPHTAPAVLALIKDCLQFPSGLRPSFDSVLSKLERLTGNHVPEVTVAVDGPGGRVAGGGSEGRGGIPA
jgi:hypothetical protein